MKELLSLYETQRLGARSPRTVELYQRVLHEFATVVEPTGPPLQPMHVAAYRSLISEHGNAGSTQALKLTIVQAFAHWAEQNGGASPGLAGMCEAARFPVSAPRVALPDEVKHLIETAPKRLLTPLLLAAHLGLREGEIRGLTWGMVDLTPRLESVTVIGKGNKLRGIPCSHAPELVEHLRLIQKQDASAYVAPGECGKKLAAGSFGKALGRHCVAQGMKHVNPHALRHYRAGEWATDGVNSSIISRLMGHSNSLITERYLSRLSNVDVLREGLRRAYQG